MNEVTPVIEKLFSSGEGGSVFVDRSELFCIFQPDLTLTYVNPACCRHFGKSSQELVGKSYLIFILEEDRSTLQQKLPRLTREFPALTYECSTLNDSGESIWYRWTIRAVFSRAGEISEYQTIGRDLTRQRRAELELRAAKKRYEAVVEGQTELVCRYLPDGTLVFANQAYCKFHGRKKSELINKNIFLDIRADHHEKLHSFLSMANPQNPTSIEAQCIACGNHESLWVEWRRRAFFDESGHLCEIQSVGRDITELKRTEAALKSSESELRQKNIELERKNVALTEVLEQIEQQKQQIKDDVIANADDLLIPVLEQLISKGSKLDAQYLNLIERSLKDLTASFGRKITKKSLKLTQREIQICGMIRQGLTSKEIANLLNISLNTVSRHRHSIRKKAALIEKKENLYSFLQNV